MLKKRKFFIEHFVVFILLFFSGNPLASHLFGKFSAISAFIICYALLGKNRLGFAKGFWYFYLKIAFFLLIIFGLQEMLLDYVSWLGSINFLVRVLLGGLVVYALGEHFEYYFFNIVVYLSIISLVGFLLLNILKIPIPGYQLSVGSGQTSFFLFGVTKYHMLKNEGMFWEPGAFAGILTLCLALNFRNISIIWKYKKWVLISIILALITTQSTSGYLVLFTLIVLYIFQNRNPVIAFFFVPVAIIFGSFVFESIPFLKDKVEGQYTEVINKDNREFTNSRFGALAFDYEGFLTSPFIGLGLHEESRYAKNKELLEVIKRGESLGHGNSFSKYLSGLGGLFVFFYFFLLFKCSKINGVYFGFVILIVVFLNLQGEDWFEYPLYCSLIFLRLKNSDTKN